MASIQRIVSPLTKDISYRAQVRVKGRPPESKTFTNRKDAKEWAGTLESAITDARYFPSRKAPVSYTHLDLTRDLFAKGSVLRYENRLQLRCRWRHARYRALSGHTGIPQLRPPSDGLVLQLRRKVLV